jgi:predicted enzyme related to lactoylglutathione lyase
MAGDRLDKTIVHFEIPAKNVEKLKGFYEKLFGWKFVFTSSVGMDYWMIQTVPTDEKGMLLRPGVNGGMYEKENDQQKPTNWIQVDDLDAQIKLLKKLGGRLIMDKMEIPGIGWSAVGVDPEGNQVAMMQPKM